MSEGDTPWQCGSDGPVSLSRSRFVQGEPPQVYPGLLALSSVCGVMTGVLTAALILYFCVRPYILNSQGYNIRRLLEPEEAELEISPRDPESDGKNDRPGTSNKDDALEKKPPVVSGDVAAFATKAKVVYPINQKYRPLADGASNPSLHEAADMPLFSGDAPSHSSSSCCDEDSEEEDEDCEGQNGDRHFVSSALPQSLQNYSFTAVSNRALTLALTSGESQMNLYFLALRDVQQKHIQLQEQKEEVYGLMMKTLFGNRFPKNKLESDFFKTILHTQKRELSELKTPSLFSEPAAEESEQVVTLEEIERSPKELLEHGLHTSKGLSNQVENLSQLLLRKNSVFHLEEAQEIITSIFKTLLVLENNLQTRQDSFLRKVHEQVLWFQEFKALLQTQPDLLSRETRLRQSLISTVLEQMISDGDLAFSQMEKILSQIQDIQSEALRQYNQECAEKTSYLVTEEMSRLESKRRKMLKKQNKERLVLHQPQSDLQSMLKVHNALALRHQQQLQDLEMQQELRLTEAITELWTSLRSSKSSQLGDQCKSVLLSSFSESSLTQNRVEKLWSHLEQALLLQLQEAEHCITDQLQETRNSLHGEGQTWREEMVLMNVCLKHLRDHQVKSLQALELRQSYSLHSQGGRLLALKHLHLLGALQRLFVVRHVSLNLLKKMRLAKLGTHNENDRSALSAERCQDTTTAEGSGGSVRQWRWAEESCLLELSLKQEFLSELETGAELLQRHLHIIIGNALSHSILQEMEREPSASDPFAQGDSMKCHLTEAASESVYLTKDSLCALVQKYYSQLQRITGQLQQEPPKLSDDEEEPEQSAQIMKSLLRELQNWSRKPGSAEFQQRVEQHKLRLLAQTDREPHRLWEGLRRRQIHRDITLDKVKDQLMGAEESFIEELAALARVPLPEAEKESGGEQENASFDPRVNIQELLALNPALDPALNPSLTPLVSGPAKVVMRDKKT